MARKPQAVQEEAVGVMEPVTVTGNEMPLNVLPPINADPRAAPPLNDAYTAAMAEKDDPIVELNKRPIEKAYVNPLRGGGTCICGRQMARFVDSVSRTARCISYFDPNTPNGASKECQKNIAGDKYRWSAPPPVVEHKDIPLQD